MISPFKLLSLLLLFIIQTCPLWCIQNHSVDELGPRHLCFNKADCTRGRKGRPCYTAKYYLTTWIHSNSSCSSFFMSYILVYAIRNPCYTDSFWLNITLKPLICLHFGCVWYVPASRQRPPALLPGELSIEISIAAVVEGDISYLKLSLHNT